MNLDEIIKKFLKKGYFIDKEIVKNFNKEYLIKILSLLPKSDKPVKLSKDKIIELSSFFEEKIEIVNLVKKGEFSILDVVKLLKKRYEYFYNLLVNKTFLPVVSINKIGKIKNFGIIGLVYKKDGNKLYVEDITGKVIINNISNKEVWEDACYFFVCKKEIDIKCIDIIYPEIVFSNIEKTISINFGKLVQETDINIIFSNEIKVDRNKIYLNLDFQPCYQIKLGNSLIVVIDSKKIEFNLEKITKTRLIETKIEKAIQFGKDIFLLENSPSIFILIGDKNKILEESPLVVEVSTNTIIDTKNKKLINS